jgi:hypothetical protein
MKLLWLLSFLIALAGPSAAVVRYGSTTYLQSSDSPRHHERNGAGNSRPTRRAENAVDGGGITAAVIPPGFNGKIGFNSSSSPT